VKNRNVLIALAGLMALVLFNYGCKKFDTTTLGGDLIPEIDNINTFGDTLDITATQGFFTDADTTIVALNDAHVLGKIENDPLFGKTSADVYLQFKPTFYPYYFGASNDTLVGLDSMVLCLNYAGFWGDSTIPQQLQVFEVTPDATDRLWDSAYANKPVTYAPATGAPVSTVQNIDVRQLQYFSKISRGKDSVTNQIRIKLDNNSAWVQALYSQDSSLTSVKNGFYNDSTFRKKFPGLAIKAISGNAVLYTTLSDPKTRLEVHFRKKRAGINDTISANLAIASLTGLQRPSVSANHVVRDRSTGSYPPANTPTDELYLQTSPGTYANLTIPALTGYPNRLIHRAQIIIEQVPGDIYTDSVFSPPNFMYLDLKDSGLNNNFKPVYYDLNPFAFYNPDRTSSTVAFFPSQVDYSYFGGVLRRKKDPLTGRSIAYYNINLSRYVQQIATHQSYNYTLRLYAPFTFRYPQLSPYFINYNNPLAYGRIRVGSGSNANYKMKMVIIYSKV